MRCSSEGRGEVRGKTREVREASTSSKGGWEAGTDAGAVEAEAVEQKEWGSGAWMSRTGKTGVE